MAIVGYDGGNITAIATSISGDIVVESRVTEATSLKRLGKKDYFVFEGEELIANSGEFENDLVKFEKENFIKILFYAIAKATTSNNIELVTGIPGKQYNLSKDSFKKFLQDNSEKTLIVDGIERNIKLNKIEIVPEGYSLKTIPWIVSQCKKGYETLVFDLGGGTSDTALFDENFGFIDGDSITFGLLDLYRNTRKHINNKYNLNISLEKAKRYFDGELTLPDGDISYKNDLMKEYIRTVINELKGLYPNVGSMNVILTGGGAKKIYQVFKKLYPNTILVEDIRANAKGYLKIGEKIYG